MENTQHIRHLLDEISHIVKKHNEILDATGARFNVFDLCGVAHYENTHSDIIAEFLNRNGSHSLGTAFLDAFLEELNEELKKKEVDIARFDTKTAKIVREADSDGRRMDILIGDKNQNAILIENKIYAGDQGKQLQDYEKFTLKQFKHCVVLYLTLDGHGASEQSAGNVNYIPISYAGFIIQWLEKYVSIAARHPFVRESLVQYINHIKSLTGQNINQIMNQEIIAILMKDSQKRSAYWSLLNMRGNLIKAIAERFSTQLSGAGFNPQPNLQEQYRSFFFDSDNLKEANLRIVFGFERENFGLLLFGFYCINGDIKTLPKTLKQNIISLFSQKYKMVKSDHGHWCCWAWSENKDSIRQQGMEIMFSDDFVQKFIGDARAKVDAMLAIFDEAKKSTK
jgi:hypothetical protein